MKKLLLIVAVILAVAASIYYLPSLLKTWNGLKPVVLKPAEDINQIINAGGSNSVRPNSAGPLKLPAGFSVAIFAKDLGNPRVMVWGPDGYLLTSLTAQGKVMALADKDADGIAETVLPLAENLNRPHGLAVNCSNDDCRIYIAESDQVAVYDYDRKNVRAVNKRKIIDLPDGGRHFTRTIMFLPEPNADKLLIAVGSSCDVCDEKDWRRAKIIIVNADGSNLMQYASGLRNSVFMTIHPVTGKVWATEMGRDNLGDNLPPDEINILEGEGRNYGWPICYGKNEHDIDFDRKVYVTNPCAAPLTVPSYIDIPAHSAPLGLAFFPEEGWPESYWHNLLVAYHGSWNRSEPTGYKIVRYKLDSSGRYLGQEDFMTGWLTSDGQAIGRPVDILIQPGGAIFVSDDKAGVIYRITYNQEAAVNQ